MIFLKNMILTSSLYESIELVKKFLDKNTESKKILFIPTATNVDEYKKYIHLTQKAFEDFGYEVENFDISIFSEEIAKEKLSQAKIVFISGGNTFYLLQELKRKNLTSYLKERIENGLLYIGESAGSVIAAPDIEYASIVDDKTLATELDDYTGLNLVDFYIVPHFEEEPFVESSRNTVELYKDKLDLKLINNKEAILIENNNFTIIK
ncbi:Type 1 glutamine amidotransferase-like domain-containing protein [Leptotrichia trevisanii]|uniref:Type 1 glutamine amidotransferase-like domain-containing protein n=1 Tax=Leptotrichia trevisanii TaxID=109328 RepID=UPI0011BEC714|nr:Type 1 glutamine amidotransferase-like domain-containing protein [Leptotrichia trevisanii]